LLIELFIVAQVWKPKPVHHTTMCGYNSV